MRREPTPSEARSPTNGGRPGRHDREAAAAVAVVALAAAAVTSVVLLPFVDLAPVPARGLLAPAEEAVAYVDPPDPPAALAPVVAAGRALMLDPTLGRTGLACSSCHFEAGRTAGGRNGGLSLVGAAAAYPRAETDGEVRTLAAQVNRCLAGSLGGEPLSEASDEMLALSTYLHWLSVGTPVYRPPPWLGAGTVGPPEGTAPAGETVFLRSCAPCHGADGAGSDVAPAVWGPGSFGWGSPLAEEGRMAGFVLRNMPRENPFLERDEAVAVTFWLLERPRPG